MKNLKSPQYMYKKATTKLESQTHTEGSNRIRSVSFHKHTLRGTTTGTDLVIEL